MHRHVWRVTPIEDSRRQTVMLRERKPVPDPVAVHRALHGVLAKAGEQMFLVRHEPACLQAGVQRMGDARYSAKNERRSMPLDPRTPGIGEDSFLELDPIVDADVHRYEG